ncbi:MAG: hypothetical protein ACKVU0_16585 [Saprospiraceae bacterium]
MRKKFYPDLYRSSDGGHQWQKMPLTPADSWSWPLVAGADGNLYAGKHNKLHQSTDNGETWSEISTISHETIYALPGGEILIGTPGGIKRSIDNGGSWQTVTNITDASGGFVFNPNTGDVYAWQNAVNASTVWVSSDNGFSWSVLFEDSALSHPYQWSFGPNGVIFMGARDLLWRSLDNGLSWTSIDPMLPNSEREVSVGVSITGRVFAFEWFMSKYSDDNGLTWLPLTDGGQNELNLFYSTPEGSVFALRGYGGSLHRSDDDGATWHFSANGILSSDVLTLKHLDDTRMLALTPDGLFYSIDGGDTWQLKWEAVNYFSNLIGHHSLQAAPDGSWYLWTGFNFLKFTDEGQSYTVLQVPKLTEYNFNRLWISPQTGAVFVRHWNGFYISNDGGQNWLERPNFYLENLLFMPDGSLLSTRTDGVHKSFDEAQSWVKIADHGFSGSPYLASNGGLYVTSGIPSALFKSFDGGLTWDSIPPFNEYLVYNPVVNDDGLVFAYDDTPNCALVSADGGQSFDIYAPLPTDGSANVNFSLNPAQYLFSPQERDGIYRTSSATTDVKTPPKEEPILRISPNPFRESTLLTINGQLPAVQSMVFELFDNSGKKQYSIAFTGTQLRIDRGELTNGAYHYWLKTSQGMPLGAGTIFVLQN